MYSSELKSSEDYSELKQTNVPIMQIAVRVIYDMSDDTRIKGIARMREKALHGEASALKNAKEEGRAEERNSAIKRMRFH